MAEGGDVLGHLVSQLAGDRLVTYAAAVHDGHVHIQAHIVKEVIHGVGGKVSGVGLLAAHQAVAVGVIVVQYQLGAAYDLAQLFVNLPEPGLL